MCAGHVLRSCVWSQCKVLPGGLQDYSRSADEDEEYGITHLRAHALGNDIGSGRLQTVGEEGEDAYEEREESDSRQLAGAGRHA